MGIFGLNKYEIENQALKKTVDEKSLKIEQLTSELAVTQNQLKYADVPLDKLRQANHRLTVELEAIQNRTTKLQAWNFFETDNGQYGYVYTLLLEDNNYYVGHTYNLRDRLISHFNGVNEKGFQATVWTQVHQPVALIDLVEFKRSTKVSSLKKCENQKTLSLIRTFGYQHVRGGVFVREESETIKAQLLDLKLQKEFHFSPVTVGLDDSETVKSGIIASFQPAATPIENYIHLKRFVRNNEISEQQYTRLANQHNWQSYAVVVMANHGENFVFSRQFSSLDHAFQRLEDNQMAIADYSGESADFEIVQELIMYTHEECPNKASAEKLVDKRYRQLLANHRQAFLEAPDNFGRKI